MTNDLIQYSIPDIQVMANAMAKSRLFGLQTAEQAMALMLISQAEGRHPALASRDYDIIQGKPAKKAEAMMRDFIASGGTVVWERLDDTAAIATFSHPSGGSVKIDWTIERAKKAGLGSKGTWIAYPRAMLRSRCVSEGIRTVCPAATSGFYEPGEVQDFVKEPRFKDVTPAKEPIAEPVALKEAEVVKPEQGQFDYKSFGKQFSEQLLKCTSLEELEKLKSENTDKLLGMAEEWEAGFAKVEANILKMIRNLSPIEELQ